MVARYPKFPEHFTRINHILRKGVSYPWPYRIVRMALAGLFIYGGVTKLLDPEAFAITLSAYDLAPEMFLPVLAVGLPVVETIAGLALVFDRPWGLHVIMGLLALFVFVLGYGILTDLNVDCGCFGVEDLDKRAGLRAAFYRDLILIGVVMPYLYLSRRIREYAGNRKGNS